MRCIILANGEYGEIEAYRKVFRIGDTILCADGGANYAYELGLKPDCIIGDLDSIKPEVKKYFETCQVDFHKYSPRKDFTDMQLVLSTALELGADEIVLLGTLGGRLDHTLANLYSGIDLVRKGIKLSHYAPECCIHIINQDTIIEGHPGDIVSVLTLTDEAQGVSEVGFEYTPADPCMENSKPYAISNVLVGQRGIVGVQSGILAVFHYSQ
jgi:thiamine pyrophosphokinase